MESNKGQRFIDALHRLEEDNDLDGMVALYAEDAELSNPTATSERHGRDGARQFWEVYRGSFQEIHSEFRNVTTAGDVVFLEWRSRGRTIDGSPVEYDGVSVVEFTDDQVRRFRAYFDPAAVSVHAAGRGA